MDQQRLQKARPGSTTAERGAVQAVTGEDLEEGTADEPISEVEYDEVNT